MHGRVYPGRQDFYYVETKKKVALFLSCPIARHMLKYKKAYINTIEIANSIIQIWFHLEPDISVSIYAFIH